MAFQIKSPVLTPAQASQYIGINTQSDALKASRSTGQLWGVAPPPFMKCGRKVLYKVSDLDEWLSQFTSYTNNAQISLKRL